MSQMNAIEIRSLSKFYKNFQALDCVSISVPEGDFFGFLGPNGAGMTTTIHAMTGLANFQTGEIKIFGFDVIRDYRKTRSLIGFVPQEFNFDPYLTAEQILVFEGGYFGMAKGEAKERAIELLKEFDLLDHRKLDYRKLSGGMKRRLLIARGLMHKPRILILDEPTAGVDVELRLRMWDFLKEINRKGITIFLTTHYIEEAERLCKRIGVIHKGKIIAVDQTETMVERLGRQVIKIRLDKTFQDIPAVLKNFGLELMNGGDTIRFRNDEKKLSDLFKTLSAQGIGITGVETEKTSLEDIFLEMTKS